MKETVGSQCAYCKSLEKTNNILFIQKDLFCNQVLCVRDFREGSILIIVCEMILC